MRFFFHFTYQRNDDTGRLWYKCMLKAKDFQEAKEKASRCMADFKNPTLVALHESLGGGLEYCRVPECSETVHYEDAPDFYPCCPKHASMNKAYREMVKERREFDELNKELYG